LPERIQVLGNPMDGQVEGTARRRSCANLSISISLSDLPCRCRRTLPHEYYVIC
jgi:hypothetical protein